MDKACIAKLRKNVFLTCFKRLFAARFALNSSQYIIFTVHTVCADVPKYIVDQ